MKSKDRLRQAVDKFAADFEARYHPFGKIGRNDKHPLAKGGIRTAVADPGKLGIPDKATGFCVYPADFVVIDCDVGPGKNGYDELARIAKARGETLPDTAAVRSPSGGVHLYFDARHVKGALVPSSNGKVAPGVDIRGNDGAGWVAGPGSKNSKGTYDWANDNPVAPLPDWLLHEIRQARPRVADRSKPKTLPEGVGGWDLPENVAAFSDWLKNEAKVSIEGQHGNDTLAATGAMGSSYALTEETTLALMQEHWNTRCVPPWDDDELWQHGGSGYRSAEHVGNRAVGYKTAAERTRDLFKPQSPAAETVEEGKPLLPLIRGAAIKDVPPVEWWIDDLMRHGSLLVWGLPKKGKTAVLAAAAVAIAHGKDAWGRSTYAPDGTRVLYLATEDIDGAQRAVWAACIALGVPVQECRVDVVNLRELARTPQLASESDMETVRRTMLHYGHRILIVDVMAFAAASQKLTEADGILTAMAHVSPLFDRDRISTWLATHSTKSGADYYGGVQLKGTVYQSLNVDDLQNGIGVTCDAMRGAAPFDGALHFERKSIPLPGLTDGRGKQADAMFPEFKGVVRSVGKGDKARTKVLLLTEALEAVLKDAEVGQERMRAGEAAQKIRQWLIDQGFPNAEIPTADAIRAHFLYKVRSAVSTDPEYPAAYLIQHRDPLVFSHPERIAGVQREPRRATARLFKVVEGGKSSRRKHRKG